MPAAHPRQEHDRGRADQRHARVWRRCSTILAQAQVLGAFFQPWALDYTLNFPGGNGGANWGGASYDAQANLVFVNTMDVGVIVKLEKAPPGSKLPYRFRGAPHTVFWTPNITPAKSRRGDR